MKKSTLIGLIIGLFVVSGIVVYFFVGRRPASELTQNTQNHRITSATTMVADQPGGGLLEAESFRPTDQPADPPPYLDELSLEPVGETAAEREVPTELLESLEALSLAGLGSGEDARIAAALATKWLAIDSDEAFAWAVNLPEGLARISLREMAFAAEPDIVSDLFEKLNSPDTEVDESTLGYGLAVVLDAWSDTAPQEAWDAAAQIKDRYTRAMVYSGIGDNFAEISPEAAAKNMTLATSLFPVGSEESEMMSPAFGMIAENWAQEDLDKAIEWVDSLPQGSGRTEATKGLTAAWLKQDPAGSSEWLNNLPDGAARDGGILSLISTNRSTDPSRSLDWAMTLSNTALKRNMVIGMGQILKETDEVAFQKWLSTPAGRDLDKQWKSEILDTEIIK